MSSDRPLSSDRQQHVHTHTHYMLGDGALLSSDTTTAGKSSNPCPPPVPPPLPSVRLSASICVRCASHASTSPVTCTMQWDRSVVGLRHTHTDRQRERERARERERGKEGERKRHTSSSHLQSAFATEQHQRVPASPAPAPALFVSHRLPTSPSIGPPQPSPPLAHSRHE